MKKHKLFIFIPLAAALSLMALFAVLKVEAIQDLFGFGSDADLPGILQKAKSRIDKKEYMRLRDEQIEMYRGMHEGDPIKNIKKRNDAVEQMEKQEEQLRLSSDSYLTEALLAAWTPIGPNPIPNGPTAAPPVTAASGRITAIAVHPTNPNIVYVGTAQGGLYRSLDGGTNWTPLMDNALSLVIGSIAIASSQPDTIYVGTGEGYCARCFMGVGIYRIDNASTSATLTGPLNKNAANVDVFTGRSIPEIVVHPTNPAIIFAVTGHAAAGLYGSNPPTAPTPERGIFRSFNATSANPTFEKLFVNGLGTQDRGFVDLIMDPGNPNLILATLADPFSSVDSGVYRSTNALATVPTFTKTFTAVAPDTDARTEMAYHKDSNTGTFTVYLASGHNGGTVHKSTDGGASFAQTIDNDFCTPQCFYDIAVGVDPTNPNRVYLGGSPNLVFGFSNDGGASFTQSRGGLHVDSHAITVSPSSPNVIYFGSDGGIYKSTDSGANWTTLNNSQFYATQFMGLDTHPTDPNFTIGGTQDNGTIWYKPDGTWYRIDSGDGGFSVIDQSAANTTTTNMYHTYHNTTTFAGYGWHNSPGTAGQTSWTFRGCFHGTVRGGVACPAKVLFYAPLERGPSVPGSNGNTIYFGTDQLYRSIDTGATHTQVSQQFGEPISAIGISPQNDNIRIVGLKDGGLFGTTTGGAVLTNFDLSNNIPNNYISRVIIDPTNSNTAYVTLNVFNIEQIYKTENLQDGLGANWTPISGASTGLPLVPVNAFAVENNVFYAGTDIGVYFTNDGGANWYPFGTGLPRIAIFDMAFAGTGANRVLRIATHGKGMYQIPAVAPQAILSVSGTVSYALNTVKKISNATLTAAGMSSANALTTSTGTYSLNNLFTDGQYTVTPSKTGGANNITAFDATLVLRCVAAGNNCTLTVNQKTAADTDGQNGVTAFDATLILRYVAANGQNANTGQTGNWKFDPASRIHNLSNSSVPNQNYTGILIGEIDGDWSP
ncbi:MAG: hypothetical protein M3209_11805 [Acidobacteriota bacterium]|nr:hypothetical protein [Acidobacteriota bacterium]